MADELAKRAAEMLLRGATLVSEPCPYCRGVRVIKDGDALCTSCGRTPEHGRDEKAMVEQSRDEKDQPPAILQILEKKMSVLSAELEAEADHLKQQEIIRSIGLLAETIGKLKEQPHAEQS